MKQIKAIQIIGTQRSGSNLLRVMLNQIQEIDAPHPPHILQRFYPLLAKYGDLDDELSFINLIDDVCKLIEKNPVPWEGFKLDREIIQQQCSSNTLHEIFRVIYHLKAMHSNASFWCCKSMSNINYVESIEASGIKPFYIHLYRDGRDVALSFKKAIVGPKHIYHIAKKWKEEQELCIQLKINIDKGRFISICYEDLIKNPEHILKQLCAFLKIPFSNTMLNYYKSDESIKTALSGKMWANISQPILKNNYNKFLEEMDTVDLSLFENIAGNTLIKLNYKLYSNGDYKSISKEDMEAYHVENELLKQKSLLNADKEDLSKKSSQLQLLKDIENRIIVKAVQ
ncbi:sulfotransferase family protein [Pseudalgibacter alginicilyticus]|nr:sulfotransferase [Pseudalgibacter alginicilyticus]